MAKRHLALLAASLILALISTSARALSDTKIRQAIIRESIASYPGPCACPYSVMRNGGSCGGRSAYSRPGGYAPLCYPADVSREAVEAYRHAHGG